MTSFKLFIWYGAVVVRTAFVYPSRWACWADATYEDIRTYADIDRLFSGLYISLYEKWSIYSLCTLYSTSFLL